MLRVVATSRIVSIHLVVRSTEERLPIEVGRLVATQNLTRIFSRVVTVNITIEATANDGRSI